MILICSYMCRYHMSAYDINMCWTGYLIWKCRFYIDYDRQSSSSMYDERIGLLECYLSNIKLLMNYDWYYISMSKWSWFCWPAITMTKNPNYWIWPTEDPNWPIKSEQIALESKKSNHKFLTIDEYVKVW